MELRDALVKLKARATAVQQEKAQVQALLTAASPDQTSRLVAEIGTLRERMGAFLAQKACSAINLALLDHTSLASKDSVSQSITVFASFRTSCW